MGVGGGGGGGGMWGKNLTNICGKGKCPLKKIMQRKPKEKIHAQDGPHFYIKQELQFCLQNTKTKQHHFKLI